MDRPVTFCPLDWLLVWFSPTNEARARVAVAVVAGGGGGGPFFFFFWGPPGAV